MPPKTRASAISETALEKLEKVRVPGRTSESTVKDVLSPKTEARMNAAEPLREAWAEGYSGCAGVPALKKSSQGSQAGLASAGVRPSRIAVIGRQNANRYLLSQHAIAASAMERFSSAKRRAFWTKDKPCCTET